MSQEVESATSEINILPDGRICVFGASQQVLEILDAISMNGPALKRRIERLGQAQEQNTIECVRK